MICKIERNQLFEERFKGLDEIISTCGGDDGNLFSESFLKILKDVTSKKNNCTSHCITGKIFFSVRPGNYRGKPITLED